ncbi:MAG: hypothetical protein QF515_00120 [Pseudomonadales bacterium]|nr:hypothetical protein [Pseudomonadales bacterium]MDP6471297.1 hypothetical protein [Pseudomonadales bacterium]MDP6825514.1 hypothetical protein [Pseudomonadales bacterium]
MKQRTPRAFRWTEAMNTPHIRSPEFADFPMQFASDDELPGKTPDLLKLCLEAAGKSMPRTAKIYNAWVQDKTDEPVIGKFKTLMRGVEPENGASLYSLRVHQRTLNWFNAQSAEAQQVCYGGAFPSGLLKCRAVTSGHFGYPAIQGH